MAAVRQVPDGSLFEWVTGMREPYYYKYLMRTI